MKFLQNFEQKLLDNIMKQDNLKEIELSKQLIPLLQSIILCITY